MSPEINILVWGLRDTFKDPEIIEMRVLGFSRKQIERLRPVPRSPHVFSEFYVPMAGQIEKLLVPSEAEEFYGAFKHIFSINLP